MDLSIAIVSYNTVDILEKCLQSILDETQSITYEIIVVDNDSEDKSAERAKDFDERVIVIENHENSGFAKAVNQALAIAKGEYFLMLNPDCVIGESSIQKSVLFLRSHDERTVMTCHVVNAAGEPHRQMLGSGFLGLRAQLVMYLRIEFLFAWAFFIKNAVIRNFNFQEVNQISFASGCYIMIRRKFMRELGGLDEQFALYAEDQDLCLRIYQNDGHILFFPDTRIIHTGSESTKKIGRIAHEQMISNRYKLYRKHYGRLKASLYAGIRFIGAIIDLIRLGKTFVMSRNKVSSEDVQKTIFTILWCVGIRRARQLPQHIDRV